MRPSIKATAVLVAGLALVSATLQPASATTTTLVAQADSFVLSTSPNANKGAITPVKINDDTKRAYFRFSLSTLPAGETVSSATLRLFFSTSPRCSLGAEVLRSASESWGESTITWSNQPGPTGGPVATVGSWTANSYVEFDVTSAVSGTGTVSFVLRHASGCTPTGDDSIQSREGAQKPQLVVSTTAGSAPQCSDGQDNDGDGKTDFPDDPGCTDANDNNETDPTTPTQKCGPSGSSTICITLPSSTLSGMASITVTKSPNSGQVLSQWAPNGRPLIHLRQMFGRDPTTNNYSFLWPTNKYLDASGVLRVRAGASATPVEIPVTLSNGNVSDYQHNPNDWANYLPGAWNQPNDPVIPAVGDGPDGLAPANQVADLINGSKPALVLALGDLAYEKSSHTELVNNYGISALDSGNPTKWGRFADKTQPVLGNHENPEGFVADWIDYWHGRPRFVSYNFGGALFLALDSTTSSGFKAGTAQYQFVQNALTSGAPPCVIAYAHHPVLTGSQVNDTKLPMWQLLAGNGADLYLVGHAHFMAEYQPLDANLQPGPGAHLIEMISGAGGHNIAPNGKSDPRQVFLRGGTPGAVFLTLIGAANGGTASSISWQWKSASGTTLSSGSTTC